MTHPNLRGDDSKSILGGGASTSVAAAVVAAASPRGGGGRPRSCSGEIRDAGWRAMFDEGVAPENAIKAIFAQAQRHELLNREL